MRVRYNVHGCRKVSVTILMEYRDYGLCGCGPRCIYLFSMLTVVGCSVLRARRGLALARRAARPRAGGLRGSLFGVVVVTTIDLRLRHALMDYV